MCKSVNDKPTNFHTLRRRPRLVWPPSGDMAEMARRLKVKCLPSTSSPADCCAGTDCAECAAARDVPFACPPVRDTE